MKTITMNNPTGPIVKVQHDQERTMRLTWKNGNVYDYSSVRMNDAVDLAWSKKPIDFFNAKFRDHECKQVDAPQRELLA